jgi:HEAT repeat protein
MRFALSGFLALLLVLPADAQPASDRPSDDLLAREDVQAVVEAQVDRDRAALREALDADVPAVRARAAHALASTPDTSAIPALLSLLTDGVPLVRTDAAFALAQMPDGVPADRLLEVLRYERDEAMQRRLIETLGRTGDAASQDALLALGLPSSRDTDVALALAHYGRRGHADSSAAAWLVEHLTAESAAARRHAAYALGQVAALARQPSARPDTIRHALDGYSSGDPAAQPLIRALGRLDDPADTRRLVDWLRSGTDWRTRVEAARALGGRDTAAARTALVQALGDDHALVARTAAETLARLDWPADTQTAVGVWLDAHPDRWRVGAPLLEGWARNGPPARVRRTLRRWQDEPSPFAVAAALPALASVEAAWADSLLATAGRADDPRVAAGPPPRASRPSPTAPSPPAAGRWPRRCPSTGLSSTPSAPPRGSSWRRRRGRSSSSSTPSRRRRPCRRSAGLPERGATTACRFTAWCPTSSCRAATLPAGTASAGRTSSSAPRSRASGTAAGPSAWPARGATRRAASSLCPTACSPASTGGTPRSARSSAAWTSSTNCASGTGSRTRRWTRRSDPDSGREGWRNGRLEAPYVPAPSTRPPHRRTSDTGRVQAELT